MCEICAKWSGYYCPCGISRYTERKPRHMCVYLVEVDDCNAAEAVHVSVETVVEGRRLMNSVLFRTRLVAADVAR